MYSLKKEFKKLLNSKAGIYHSNYDVEISYDLEEREGIHLASDYPDYMDEDDWVSLNLALFYPSITDFFEAFA